MMLLLSLVVGELQDKASQLGMFSEFTMTHVEPPAKYVAPLIQIVHTLAVNISQQPSSQSNYPYCIALLFHQSNFCK